MLVALAWIADSPPMLKPTILTRHWEFIGGRQRRYTRVRVLRAPN